MSIDLILGTAGHIDHGKTSLVRALTGVDTDRLPEEKKRGITIDLGFAQLALGDYRLGIVDVPGHERFVRNMLAGATGMDLALLVVAADDSIKPQTVEHLDILRLLDLPAGVIALTKCDLAEPSWIDLVEEEIRERVADTFLANAPIIRTSAASGAGIDELRAALATAAERAAAVRRRSEQGPFRMAIDRTFTVAGHGTVVTGSVSSGTCRLGDELLIEPGTVAVRVRGLENHDQSVDEIHRGQRAAINLAGVHHNQIVRGQELATPGHLAPSRLMIARLSLLADTRRPLKDRTRVRVHVGTAELMASVRLLDRERLEPGESAPVQLFLSEPAVVVWSQPLVVRSESPVATIGGGYVLVPNAERIRQADEVTMRLLEDLLDDVPQARAGAALFFAGLRDWKPDDLARTAGIDDPQAAAADLLERGDLVEIPLSPTRALRAHRLTLDRLAERIAATLARLHEQNPLRSMIDRQQLAHRFDYLDAPLLDAVLQRMAADKRIRVSQRGLALEGHGPQLSAAEQKLVERIIADWQAAGIEAPLVKDYQAKVSKNQAAVPQLVALAAAEGHLVEIAQGYYLHADAERTAKEQLQQAFSDGAGRTLSQIREILGTTRKYAVPLCEYLDRTGFTRREGDLRQLAAR